MEKTYDTTKEQCQKIIEDRMPIVCSSCGQKSIKPLETVNNADEPTFWPFCSDCSIIEYGIHPDIYETARKIVDENNYRAYSFDSEPDKDKYPLQHDFWRKSQIKGSCQNVQLILSAYHEISKTNEKQ